MEGEREEKRLSLWQMIGLIVVLFAGVQLMFLVIDKLMEPARAAQREAQAVSEVQAEPEEEGPAFCPYCGKPLREGFSWGQFCPYCGERVE